MIDHLLLRQQSVRFSQTCRASFRLTCSSCGAADVNRKLFSKPSLCCIQGLPDICELVVVCQTSSVSLKSSVNGRMKPRERKQANMDAVRRTMWVRTSSMTPAGGAQTSSDHSCETLNLRTSDSDSAHNYSSRLSVHHFSVCPPEVLPKRQM